MSPRSPRRKAKRLRTRRRHTWRRFPPLYLMDTTGLAYRSKDRLLRFRRGKEVRRVRGHARLLALMRWDRERRLLWPWGGVVGEGYAPDPRLGGEVLRRFPPSRGWLLADAGFDGKEVWGVLGEAGVRPVIRLRGGGEAREEARVRAREGWDPEVYRFRGVGEGVFGGVKTRLGGGYLWERKPWTAMARALLELIAYGLRVLLSLLPPPPGYKAIY
ncbi:transposase [Thermus thermophilus]|uniref:transposase n=1 Tax=Thermus thermophilus TaxID=274 RepID=UPI002174D837|nr:transposase [Thermus thermophilus]